MKATPYLIALTILLWLTGTVLGGTLVPYLDDSTAKFDVSSSVANAATPAFSAASGLTLAAQFIPNAQDLSSSATGAVQVLELGGTTSGSGLWIISNNIVFVTKTSAAQSYSPNLADLDGSDKTIAYAFGQLTSDITYTVWASFDTVNNVLWTSLNNNIVSNSTTGWASGNNWYGNGGIDFGNLIDVPGRLGGLCDNTGSGVFFKSNAVALFGTAIQGQIFNAVVNTNTAPPPHNYEQFLWTGQANGNWDTNNSLNWNDLTTAVNPAKYVETNAIGVQAIFDDSSGITSVNLANNVKPNLITFSNSAANYTLSGLATIGGTAQIVKDNAGQVTMNVTNTGTGGVTVNGGSVVVSKDANLGAASAPLTFGGGTLEITANLTSTRPIALNNTAGTNSVLQVDGGVTASFGGPLSWAAGSVDIYGNGTVIFTNRGNCAFNVLNGTNILDQNASVTNSGYGNISLGLDGYYAQNGTLIVRSNAQLRVLGTSLNVGDSYGAGYQGALGNLYVQDNAYVLAANLGVGTSGSGTAGEVYQSGGVVTNYVAANNTVVLGGITGGQGGCYGGWHLSGGEVDLNQATWIGGLGTGELLQSGGAFNSYGGLVSVGYYPAGVGNVVISGGSFNMLGTSPFQVGRQGNGTLTVTNTGVFNMANNTMYVAGDGGSVAGTGTVNLGPGGQMMVGAIIGTANGNSTLNLNAGTLQAARSTTAFINNLTAANVFAGGVTIDTAGFGVVLPQALLDGDGMGGGLTKIGTGTLTLSGANTYTGNTVVSNGTLAIDIPGSAGSGALIVEDGATLCVTNNSGGTVNVASLTMGTTGASSLQFDFPAGNVGAASINASGALTGNGPVTINITGSGFSAGIIPLIQFSSASGLANFQLGTLPDGVQATLVTSATTSSLNISSAVKNLAWTGAADNQWNTSSIDWTNLLVANGATAYSQSGTFGYGDNVRFDDTANANTAINLGMVATPISMVVSNESLAYSFTGSGSLAGPMSLTKQGAGPLTLGTVNTFTNGGLLTNGTVFVGADSALGTGPITVGGAAVIAPTSGGSFVLSNTFLASAGANVNFGVTNGSLTLMSNLVLNVAGPDVYVTGGGTLVFKSSLQNNTNGGLDIFNGSRVVIDGALATNVNDGIRFHSSGGSGVSELDITNGGVFVLGSESGGPNVRLGQDANVPGTNVIRISSGSLQLLNTAQALVVGDKSSTTGMVYQAGGVVSIQTANPAASGVLFGSTSGAYGEYHLDGGTLSTPRIATATGATGILYLNGGILAANTNTFGTSFIGGATVYVGPGGATFDDGGFPVTNSQPLLDGGGGGGLNKIGSGALMLDGANTYTGTTTVSSGLLGGVGSFAGPVTVNSGGALAPGDADIGTLTINNNLTLNSGGAVLVKVNKDNATHDLVTGLNNVTYNGSLVVTNIGANSLAGSETYQLFSASGSVSGNFSSITIQSTNNLTGVFNPATGILTINAASTIPTTPTNLSLTISTGTLTLSWPSNYLGWSVQMQTNSLNKGLGTNWVTIPGSANVTSTNFPLTTTNGAVFYRMFYQP